ncbi:MAG: NAD(P)/FAD-dependent oxidoreductase [Bacillota bacterium]|nr:NAD(P)/FAD-dependent oxidoreductase [Bacillota bacterium]
MKKYDVCIIGGGAAGLAAASLLDSKIKKCILEKNNILGRKISATGGGRCNITNEACSNKEIVLEFFKSRGLETYKDSEGRYYPYSNQASDVVRVLTAAAADQGTDIMTGITVERIARNGSSYEICCESLRIAADNVILAAGGKAAPHMGTTGDGYAMASRLGHTINRVYPVLTGIECGDFRNIKGVRAKGTVSLYRDDRLIKAETGEIQFTEDGVSGICVFNLSLYIRADNGEDFRKALTRYHLILDLAPDFTTEEIERRESSFGILTSRLSDMVGVKEMKCWKLPVKGVKGWKNAQCTGGGISMDEVNMETMESKKAVGLYIAGEIMDVQGPCGGFNLQNAWETGIKAAQSINRKYR